ncbi:MAG: VWA domain-containing protein [Pseudomonadota bacterium]
MSDETKSKRARMPDLTAPTAHPVQDHGTPETSVSSDGDIAAFLDTVRAMKTGARAGAGAGRLIFALDATMSRQPTWDLAQAIQSEMFSAVKDVGGLDVQLVFFRGFGECRSSKWVDDPIALAQLMTTVTCRAGHTQIAKVLSHARKESEAKPVHALVYVGDAMEENVDTLGARAGELGLLGLPVFLFQEGHHRATEIAYREIARLSGGAYSRFDAGSAEQLRALLTAVAVYASGGRAALARLESRGRPDVKALLEQLPKA